MGAIIISHIEPYRPEDIPADVNAKIYHVAGLMAGDISDEMIEALSNIILFQTSLCLIVKIINAMLAVVYVLHLFDGTELFAYPR